MGISAKAKRGWIDRPDPSEDFTANPVELFFDLAFVFAFSQLVSHLVHHPDVEGMLKVGLIFWMLWLPWTQFTWSANAVSAHSRHVQRVVLIATVASIPMAAATTTALGDGGWLFAGSVVVILAMGLVMMMIAHPVGSDEWKSTILYARPNLIAMAAFLAGAALEDETSRIVLWVAGIAIVAYGTVKAGGGDWVVRPGHFAERHGLIIIIALGEVIVAIAVPVLGALSEEEGLPADTIGSLIAAGMFAALLWWAYFDRPQRVFEHRFSQLHGPDKSRYARDVYTYLHALIVGGVIVSAAALEEITLHPSSDLDLEFRVMLLVGLVMFFGGIEAAVLRAFRVFPPERALAMAALAALLLGGSTIDGLWLIVAIDLIILVALVFEGRRVERLTN